MKKLLFITALFFTTITGFAQENAEQLYQNAKLFMQQRDYANASLILVRALKLEPQNLPVAKDLALNYYLQREYDKAVKVLVPFYDKNTADDQAYQIGGMVYKAAGNYKEADKLYKKALKVFPSSGPLYNDYGELLWNMQDNNSIRYWEKGIENDPSFGTNYYNASRYYNTARDNVWSLIYGEIFINIESYTARTAEIKNVLLDSYKRLYADIDLLKDTKNKSAFEVAYLTCMNKQNPVVLRGIDAESLTMIRTRFLLDWQKDYASKYPFALFDWYDQLLTQGLFPAYNQWLFGSVQNLPAYQNWVAAHKDENNSFLSLQKNNLFKMPGDQYYH